jgi:hypothetical protein
MDPHVPQLIFDFEPPSAPEGPIRISRYRKERDYFDDIKYGQPAPTRELPTLLRESPLQDPALRRNPVPAGLAEELGYKIWSSLPSTVRTAILKPVDSQSPRIAILRSGTGMDDVPWEWLNAGPKAPRPAFGDLRLVRLVPTVRAVPALTVPLPIRVLLVVADAGGGLLDSQLETRVLAQALERQNYDVQVLPEPRLDALAEALVQSPHIVHYVGHAGVSGSLGYLLLRDRHGATQWVSAADLTRILPASVRLLCLSTCLSAPNYDITGLARIAHCPPEFPLPTAIANTYAVTPPAASAFWGEFYARLIDVGDVVESFQGARIGARQASPETACWAGFSLVLRDGAERPLRPVPAGSEEPDRFGTELEAQWAARHANNLALRMRMVQAGVKKNWEKTLAEEVARVESFERQTAN